MSAGSRNSYRRCRREEFRLSHAIAWWRSAVDTGRREFGGLDILVNNAGIANLKGLEQTSEEEWDAIVNVNQKGVWLGMKTAIPAMGKRGGGSIINISSIFGLVGCSPTRSWKRGLSLRPRVNPEFWSRGRLPPGENVQDSVAAMIRPGKRVNRSHGSIIRKTTTSRRRVCSIA